MKMVRWIALLALAAVAFAALPAGAQASGSGTQLRATLHGSAAFPGADGKARFRDRGGEQELEVEVEDANRLAGTRLRALGRRKQVGTLRINRFGIGLAQPEQRPGRHGARGQGRHQGARSHRGRHAGRLRQLLGTRRRYRGRAAPGPGPAPVAYPAGGD